MDETKIEQVEATQEVETVEAPVTAEDVDNTAEVVEVPAEETEAVEVAEGCDGEKCESCKAKKEEEDDQSEKKVAVKEGLQNEHQAKQRKEVAKEQAKDVMEAMEDLASEKVADIVLEAIANLPIVEGMSEEEDQARRDEIMERGQHLLRDVYDVLEEVVNGTTLDLNGHQVEVKDFVGTGGKVSISLPAGINPPCKSEDNEDEKKVVIKAYHEGAEEIDYKSKYAEAEANMDDLVKMVEESAQKYTELVTQYNTVVEELQAYKIAEAYSISVDDAADMLKVDTFNKVCEALEEVEAEEAQAIIEGEEEKAEEKAEEENPEEKEEKKEKAEEKAMEEIKESIDGAVISEVEENVTTTPVHKAFSVFASDNVVKESKKRKAFSVFAE